MYLVPKHRLAQELLATGQIVRVVFNSNVAEVDVPDNLLGRDQVVLEIGTNMAVPILDLYVSEQGFSGTLSFRGIPRYVFVPWSAVYAIYLPDTGRGAAYGKDMPAGVQASLLAEARTPVGVTPKSHVPDYSGKVVNLAEYRARRARKDGLS